MVLGQSVGLALMGIAAGIVAALVATRMVQDLLYGVSASDPLTYLAVAAMLTTTALLAGGIPAWRASRIDPVRALREE
jgi:putative ABC transport system permease protein